MPLRFTALFSEIGQAAARNRSTCTIEIRTKRTHLLDVLSHIVLRDEYETADEGANYKVAATQISLAGIEMRASGRRRSALPGPTRTHNPLRSKHPTHLLAV